jgi:hypothetical protein
VITKEQELDAENHRKIAETLDAIVRTPQLLRRVRNRSERAAIRDKIAKMNEERKHG